MLTGVDACKAAVIGSPITHSLSPVLHRAAYAELGLTEWSYDRFAVGGPGEPRLADFLAGLGPEWIGLSVTMPLKESALALSVAASGHARELGAANTLIRTEDGWIAESTDAFGVMEALLEARVGADTVPHTAVIVGSGATARSVIDALARLGVQHVTFAVRDTVRPATLALARQRGMRVERVRLRPEALGAEAHTQGAAFADLVATTDITVSTLPTGTHLDLPEVSEGRLAGRVLMDVVYGGWPTPLARWASAGGAAVVSGVDMLLHQAAEQVRLMTGRPAPLEAMRTAVHAH